MEMEVKEDVNNKLLKRREIRLEVSYDGKTPPRSEVKEEACKKLGLLPEATAVISIDQLFGDKRSEVTLHSYSKKEDMERLSRKKGKKAAGGEAKAKE